MPSYSRLTLTCGAGMQVSHTHHGYTLVSISRRPYDTIPYSTFRIRLRTDIVQAEWAILESCKAVAGSRIPNPADARLVWYVLRSAQHHARLRRAEALLRHMDNLLTSVQS